MNPWKLIKINNNFKKYKNKIHLKLNKYKEKVIKNGIKNRNNNISKNQLLLLNNVKIKYPNLKILGADKNRGNVITDDEFWDNFQLKFLIGK